MKVTTNEKEENVLRELGKKDKIFIALMNVKRQQGSPNMG
jgi:hypothetical protein